MRWNPDAEVNLAIGPVSRGDGERRFARVASDAVWETSSNTRVLRVRSREVVEDLIGEDTHEHGAARGGSDDTARAVGGVLYPDGANPLDPVAAGDSGFAACAAALATRGVEAVHRPPELELRFGRLGYHQ